MICTGAGVHGDHCCYIEGVACEFLEENIGGRRYSCRLRRVMGSWQAVTLSFAYRRVGRFWQSIGQPFNYCQTFDPAICCGRGD